MAGVILVLMFVLPDLILDGLAAFPPQVVPTVVSDTLNNIPPALETIDIFGRLRWLLQTDNPVVFFGQQFWISMGIAIVLFTISTLTLDFWSAAVEAGGPSENPTIRRWSVGRSWPMAVMWKEFLFFTGGRSFFIAKIIGGGLVFAAFIMLQRTNGDESFLTLQGDYAWAAFLTFAGFFAIEVLLYSSGCLFYEIRQATQSTLAAIPLSGVRILLEKAGGCLIALIPSIFWLGMTVLAGYDGIARECSMTMVISVLIVLGFSSHMAVILSLYTRLGRVTIDSPAFCSGLFLPCRTNPWTHRHHQCRRPQPAYRIDAPAQCVCQSLLDLALYPVAITTVDQGSVEPYQSVLTSLSSK